MAEIVVAGHICVDIIPTFRDGGGGLASVLVPGKLVDVGAAILSTGGTVSNVGLALHRLGLDVALLGKVGDDVLGTAVLQLLRRHAPRLADGMIVAPGEPTSYSIVISPPGVDRIFLHCPGTNDTFAAADIDLARLDGARLFHFGYPPLMRRMYADCGDELAGLMRQVKSRGITTCLDMARPDPQSPAGRVDWAGLLAKVLPHVDIFLPSVDELLFMLDRPAFDRLQAGQLAVDGTLLSRLAGRLIEMGTAVAVLKLGEAGCYVRTAGDRARIVAMGAAAPNSAETWAGRELLSPCFEVNVAGTTGAGDCTIAGFLAAIAKGLPLEDCLTAATAVGAFSVEAADATSGVPDWAAVQRRIAAGWKRRS